MIKLTGLKTSQTLYETLIISIRESEKLKITAIIIKTPLKTQIVHVL